MENITAVTVRLNTLVKYREKRVGGVGAGTDTCKDLTV